MPRDAFLIYVDDWLSSGRIELMDAHEERGYFRLLLRAWKQPDCGLPTDDLTLAAWSKMGTQWFRETADRNLRVSGVTSGKKVRECFTEKAGRLFNDRQLREWNYQQNFMATRQANGKRGGRPKKEPNLNQVDNLDETNRFRDGNLEKTNLVSVSGLLVSELETSEEKKPSRVLEIDEQWTEFCGIAKGFWLDLIPEDLSGWRFAWSAMDFEAKTLAIRRLNERIAAGQPFQKVFKPTYFTRGEWKRPVASPVAQDHRTARQRAVDEALMSD
jgi:hypothetical protein